jgi:prepilin-type N-terminal cleavage/methylation domain-containing protein
MAREHGFSLLETVVALAIASMAFVALFQTGSTGLFAVDAASRADEALERAQSHLAALGAAPAVIPGDSEGDDGAGYRWHLHVRPIASRTLPPQDAGPATIVTLFDVEVSITWPARHHQREVVLRSERLAASAGIQ